ncbi:hypothetical protein QBC37DRAFT_416683 [Rhypophila decipiens]|uniref:Secreted protein n=1 Tax=Rhypophila decipiens TaxID=261697 RepID=A0AAN6YC64_9PEZI|nr:hypothetical protein QBC37DRAFT_416683 [Rhypophila decipiens]
MTLLLLLLLLLSLSLSGNLFNDFSFFLFFCLPLADYYSCQVPDHGLNIDMKIVSLLINVRIRNSDGSKVLPHV